MEAIIVVSCCSGPFSESSVLFIWAIFEDRHMVENSTTHIRYTFAMTSVVVWAFPTVFVIRHWVVDNYFTRCKFLVLANFLLWGSFACSCWGATIKTDCASVSLYPSFCLDRACCCSSRAFHCSTFIEISSSHFALILLPCLIVMSSVTVIQSSACGSSFGRYNQSEMITSAAITHQVISFFILGEYIVIKSWSTTARYDDGIRTRNQPSMGYE